MKMINNRVRVGYGLAVSLFCYAAGVAQAQPDGGNAAAFPAEARFVPNQLLVQFKPGASADERKQARAAIGAQHEETVTTPLMRDHGAGELELVSLPSGLAIAEAVGAFKQQSAVEFAEPNWIYTHDATSNDAYYANGYLWGMYGDATSPSNQYGSQAGEAWANNHTGSSDVYVGVIDEGIMFNHEDLAGNVWTNPSDPVNGVDDDGNGYIDDVHGWDFDGNNNTVYDGTQDDHGTHVAGTIGAKGGNGKGVAGVNWNVTLISAKFLGRVGGTTANAVRAVDYITNLKINSGLNIVATNNSWGGGGFSQSLLNAINRAGDADILFVVAAGNGGLDGVGDNNDTIANYPSNYQCTTTARTDDCVIAVAAITSSGVKASFSNYGATTVDIGAPGQSIYSTLPGKNNTSKYGSYSGTSMATPHVTGAAALYAATHPSATAADIRAAILGAATATSSLSGKTATGGRLNVQDF